MRWFPPACALLLLAAPPAARASPTLFEQRSSPFDLEVSGLLAGVPAGAVRYLRYGELRAMPVTVLHLPGEFTPGDQEATVVFLSDLWKALPVAAGADCILASCSDKYASVFTRGFIARYRPFLVLEINGAGPDKWPPKGLDFNPGPYVITLSQALEPAVAEVVDVEHKKPWGVTSLEFAGFADRFGDAYKGPWASLSARARAGRDLWINSCASCHFGPGRIFSGDQSHQAFPIVAAIARGDPALFKRYVRDPRSVISTAKMEPHPHYSDAQLDSIIAFVTAEQGPAGGP
jgi:hypothetical protein